MHKKTRAIVLAFSQIFQCAPKEAALMLILLACQGIVPALSLCVTQNTLYWLINPGCTFPISIIVGWTIVVLLKK